MLDMPRPRPPLLLREITRHGRTSWYVRRGDGPRIRVLGEYGSPEFWESYQAALQGERIEPRKAGAAKSGTLAWLVDQYRRSADWAALSPATRKQREGILRGVCKTAGNELLQAITRKAIVAARDRRKDRPAAARHMIETMRGLFKWAIEAELADIDPTLGVRSPRKSSSGFHRWTDEEIARYEQRWPLGTRQRLALDLLLYTGLRRGDAVRVGRPHVKDGVMTIRTEKTGEVVTIPTVAPLVESIAAGPIGELTFIAGENGRPLTKEGFGNLFREWCREAGVPGTAHGLRKAAATRAANNRATVAELEALFGWRGGGMASLYTREADRARLSKGAAKKLLD